MAVRSPARVLLLAVLLASVGQSYLMRGMNTVEAWLLYAVAAVIVLLATRAAGESSVREPSQPLTRLDIVAMALSLALAASAGALLARPALFNDAMLLYTLAGVLLGATWLRRSGLLNGDALARLRDAVSGARYEILCVAALLLLGIAFRLYALGYYPPEPGMLSDEGNSALLVLRMMANPDFRPVYEPMGGSVNLYHPIALSFALFGVHTLALRIPSVLAGILTLLPLYALARELFRKSIALACFGLFALSFWHNNVARFAFDWIYMGLFGVLAALFLLRGERRGDPLEFVAAGISLGMGIYGYAAFRLFPLVIGFYCLFKVVSDRSYLRRHAGNLVAAMAAFVLVAAPNLVVAAQKGGSWMGASFSSVIAPVSQGFTRIDPGSIMSAFFASLAGIVGRYTSVWPAIMSQKRGLLDPMVALLFVLGLFICVVSLRRGAHALLAGTIVISILVGGALTVNHNAYRYFVIIPFVYLVVGVCLERVVASLSAVASQRYINVGLAAIVACSGAWNVVVFDQHTSDCSARSLFQDRPWDIFPYIDSLGPGNHVYVISGFPWHFPLQSYAWLAQRADVEPIGNPFDAIPSRRHGEQDVVYIVTDPMDQMVSRYLRSVYPDGILEEHPGPVCSNYRFVSFSVSRQAADAVLAGPPLPPHGLRGRYYAAPGWQGDVVLQRVDATFVNAFDSDKRMSVLWDAELTIATPGVYTFTLTTAKESLLAIDGHDVVMNPGHADNVIGAQGAVALGAGQHALSIRYDRYFNNGTMELRWTLPDGSSEIVPVDLLQPETGQ